MPVLAETREYAEARLVRIEARYRYHYPRYYYMRRACDSVSRRMTNRTKLRMWAEVLGAAGYNDSATFALNRIEGLDAGSITPAPRRPRRPRLARTQVPVYVPVAPACQNVVGASMVVYEFTPEEG